MKLDLINYEGNDNKNQFEKNKPKRYYIEHKLISYMINQLNNEKRQTSSTCLRTIANGMRCAHSSCCTKHFNLSYM